MLSLPAGFSLAQFRRVSPINAENVFSLTFDRHARYMAVNRAASVGENLSRIFEATFKLSNTKGFAMMTLRDLSRETGLSMGGLYGYISSKDDLAATIEDVLRHVTSQLSDWFRTEEDPRTRVDHLLRGHVFLSEILHPWFYFVFMESWHLARTARTVARSSELAFQAELLRGIQEAGCASEQEAKLLASHFLALAQDWHVKRWKYRHMEVTPDAFADSISALIARAIG